MPLRSLAFLAYFLGSSAAALMVPMAGVICYIVLYHVYPQTTWWGLRLEFLGIRYAFVCGACLLVGTTLNLNRLRFGRHFMHPLEWGFLAMLAVMILSTFVGTAWDHHTDMVLDKMAKVFLFTFMLSHVAVTRQRLRYLVVTLVILSLYLGHEAVVAPSGSFTANRLDGIGGPDFRESSGLAVHLFAMLAFIALMFLGTSWKLKILGLLSSGYAINGALMCQTRSAFLGALAAVPVAICCAPRRHRRVVVSILVAGAIGVVILSDSYFRERMLTVFRSEDERDRSASSRLEIWRVARVMFERNPLGVGIGHFETQLGLYAENPELEARDAHNTYVLCATETGIFGIIVYLLILVTAWVTLGRAARRARSQLVDPDFMEQLIFANRLALVVFMTSGMFVSRLYTEGLWWLLILPVCISRAIENQVREEAGQPIVLHVPGPVRIVEADQLPAPPAWSQPGLIGAWALGVLGRGPGSDRAVAAGSAK